MLLATKTQVNLLEDRCVKVKEVEVGVAVAVARNKNEEKNHKAK